MKITYLTLLIFLLSSISVQSQIKNETATRPKASFEERIAFKAEYFGELVLHPGLSLGMDYTVAKKNWVTIHWDSDLGGYWHRWNNTSAFLKTSIGTRFPIGSFFADINLGAGYMHSWAAGDIYEKGANGSVQRASNWGHPHFISTGSLLFGWDGRKRNKLPWSVHIGPEVYLQSSFNHIFLPHAALKVGFTYKFKKS